MTNVEDIQDYSYCLTCGDIISRDKKFCNSLLNRSAKNKDNCLFKMKQWIESRLGINDNEKNYKLREEFYTEILGLVYKYSTSAHEVF